MSLAAPKKLLSGAEKLVGSITGTQAAADAASKAAEAQLQASREANELQKYMYDTSRNDLAPYRQTGVTALNQLAGLLNGSNTDFSAFYNSPDYKFALDQGMQGVARQAAAGGRTASGAALKEANNYAQGVASQNYGNYMNRLANLAGVGQSATNTTSALGSNYATNAGNNIIGAGNANASSYIAQGNVRAQNFNNLLKLGGTAAGFMG